MQAPDCKPPTQLQPHPADAAFECGPIGRGFLNYKPPIQQQPQFPNAAQGDTAFECGAIRQGPYHRRAQSELSFRIPNDLDFGSENFEESAAPSFEEIGSEDGLISTYMNMEKLGSGTAACLTRDRGAGANSEVDGKGNVGLSRHRHCNSVDGSMMSVSKRNGESLLLGEVGEAKKSMDKEKLAELEIVDPKRAKRILANRQSAARSKERKARYIAELERKVQKLQTEATTLSAQLTLFQRDTTGLNNENTELKMRLQAMEQQAQLCDALNEALKQEVEHLRIVTGEVLNQEEPFELVMQQMAYNKTPFFPSPQQPARHHQNIQGPQFHPSGSVIPHHHFPTQSYAFSDLMKLQDPIARLQGLDIGTHLVKSEGPSISASESSSNF
ncbi:hypothetical protein ACLOJK_012197 [Asimina triloba]